MGFLSLFIGKESKEKLAVIFDIGSASVGAALVGLFSDEAPKIFYATRREMRISKKLNARELAEKMIVAFREAASDIEREGLSHVRFTFFGKLRPLFLLYVLASPWHTSQVRIIKKREPRPFRVNVELIRVLIAKELSEFKKIHEKHFGTQTGEGPHEIIEGDILDIRLNRYQTHDPLGKMAHDLEMTLFASSSSRGLIEKIEAVGHALFTGSESRFASFTFSFFNAVRDVWHEKHNYLLLDVSGEVTDLSIVKDGRLLETVSFPVGRNTVIRYVAHSLNLSTQETESFLNMRDKNHLEREEASRLQNVLTDAGAEWVNFFSKELKEISSQILLPRDIFLTADKPLAAWFQEILQSEEISRVTPAGRPFIVTPLNERTVGSYCRIKDDIRKDPFLIVESLFLNKKIHVV